MSRAAHVDPSARLLLPATSVPHDPYLEKAARLRQRVLHGPGTLDAKARSAAANGAGLPVELGDYVAKVHRKATDVTDADIAALKTGLSEDQIFELTVSAATGAGFARLDAVLAHLDERP